MGSLPLYLCVLLTCCLMSTCEYLEDACNDALRHQDSCPCWPSSFGGLQSAPVSWHDGSPSHQFLCPPHQRFPRGTSGFHGNCTSELTCARIPECRSTYSCEHNNPCTTGRHPFRQFLHATRGRFVACGPHGQCVEVNCPGDLDFDVDHEFCTWMTY